MKYNESPVFRSFERERVTKKRRTNRSDQHLIQSRSNVRWVRSAGNNDSIGRTTPVIDNIDSICRFAHFKFSRLEMDVKMCERARECPSSDTQTNRVLHVISKWYRIFVAGQVAHRMCREAPFSSKTTVNRRAVLNSIYLRYAAIARNASVSICSGGVVFFLLKSNIRACYIGKRLVPR